MRAVLLAALLLLVPAAAEAADLHRLFEERCAGCHGDAGPFAQQALAGSPVTAERLERFLTRHGGGLGDHAGPVADMLLAQAATPPWFREQCRICHGKAADFVRDRLIVRGGTLVNRYTDRPVADLLTHHAGLSPERQRFYLDLLTRLEAEVHHP